MIIAVKGCSETEHEAVMIVRSALLTLDLHYSTSNVPCLDAGYPMLFQ